MSNGDIGLSTVLRLGIDEQCETEQLDEAIVIIGPLDINQLAHYVQTHAEFGIQ